MMHRVKWSASCHSHHDERELDFFYLFIFLALPLYNLWKLEKFSAPVQYSIGGGTWKYYLSLYIAFGTLKNYELSSPIPITCKYTPSSFAIWKIQSSPPIYR